jgi:hypothetical protein
MKKIISKLANRYTGGLALILVSGTALAQSSNVSGGWVAAGALGIAAIIGIFAVSVNNDDNNDTSGTTIYS